MELEAPTLISALRLGQLDRDELADAMRPLWENAGPLVDQLLGRSASSWDDHLAMARSAIASMDDPTRADLLRAHPPIGAAPSLLAHRSVLSYGEQGGAADRQPDCAATLATLNRRYETRFGFPFVEWVAGRPLEAIVAVLEARLGGDRSSELAFGCSALVSIAQDRLSHLRTVHP